MDEIGYKKVSDGSKVAGTFAFNKATDSKTNFDLISATEYVACYYDRNWQVGLAYNVNWDEQDVQINF